MRASHLEITQL